MAELFANVEVNRESRWQIVLGLVWGSAALHLILIAAVVYIPSLRQALNIAAMLGGSDYVSKPYARTTFGENIQMVRLAPRFQYPPGYFSTGSLAAAATATPTPTPTPTPDPNLPKIISQAQPPAKITKSPSPSPNPTSSPSPVIAQAQPSSTPSPSPGATVHSSGTVAVAAAQGKTPEEQPKTDAQKQLAEAAAANNVEIPAENEINKEPLKALAVQANDLNNKGKLDLNKSFEVVIEGMLDANGRLKDPTVTQKSGDGSLAILATDAVGALNDSGLLGYLKALNEGKPTKLIVRVSQDQNFVVAKIESDLNSEDSARQKASGFNIMLTVGQKVREGKDEEVLMSHTTASAAGKKLIFTFKMPTQAVGEMLKKQMASSSTTKG